MKTEIKSELLFSLDKMRESADGIIFNVLSAVQDILEFRNDKKIVFDDEIDCSTTTPLVSVCLAETESEPDMVFVMDEDEEYISIEDITYNELLEVAYRLILNKFKIEDI